MGGGGGTADPLTALRGSGCSDCRAMAMDAGMTVLSALDPPPPGAVWTAVFCSKCGSVPVWYTVESIRASQTGAKWKEAYSKAREILTAAHAVFEEEYPNFTDVWLVMILADAFLADHTMAKSGQAERFQYAVAHAKEFVATVIASTQAVMLEEACPEHNVGPNEPCPGWALGWCSTRAQVAQSKRGVPK